MDRKPYDDGEEPLNGAYLPQISGMGGYGNAYFVENRTMEEATEEYYKELALTEGGKRLDSQEIWRQISRNMTVSVQTVQGKNYVTMTILYHYGRPEDLGCTAAVHDGSGDCRCVMEKKYNMYDNGEYDAPLQAVYVCYQPNYGSSGKDTIRLENPENQELSFYVIKQLASEGDSGLAGREQAYMAEIEIAEHPEKAADRSAAVLRTNLGWNLGYEEEVPVLGQLKLTWINKATGEIISGSQAEAKTDLKPISNKASQERLYTIQISVYPEETKREEYLSIQPKASIWGTVVD